MNNNKILINFFSLLISIIDYKNKKKIISFFKSRFKNQILNIIDVGAHKGETIDLMIKNFKIDKIYSFEPNKTLFLLLKKKFKYKTKNIILFNKALGDKKEVTKLNVMVDSSSSTINNIDEGSKYFKRKQKIFSFFFKSKKIIQEQQNIKVERLSNIIKSQKINHINLLKIDTEGYELNVLNGIDGEDYKKINFIYFEHHYDLMIKKKYKFSDINLFLNERNFLLKYKLKMNLRKSFEYIYENTKK
tara:strand:- start:2826 stop:3563 length:738 start_codon:yes stop_codon:yes gene_type:complete